MSKKKFTPDTESGRFVGFRLKKECPKEVYDKLNEINESKTSLGEFFTDLVLKELGIVKDNNFLKKNDVSELVKQLIQEALSKLKVENIDLNKTSDTEIVENEEIKEPNETAISFDNAVYANIASRLKNQDETLINKEKTKKNRSGVWDFKK